jgi:hypothetical protein
MWRSIKVTVLFILSLLGLSLSGVLSGEGVVVAAPWTLMAETVIQNQAGPAGSAPAGEGESVKSMSLPKDFKGRHARHSVQCGDCHGTDESLKPPTMAKCLRCHGSYKDVAALTKNSHPNPHDSHRGEVKCKQCHKEHQNSELSCNQCHVFEMKVP